MKPCVLATAMSGYYHVLLADLRDVEVLGERDGNVTYLAVCVRGQPTPWGARASAFSVVFSSSGVQGQDVLGFEAARDADDEDALINERSTAGRRS